MSTSEESEWFNPSLELKGSNRACHFARYYFAQKYVINKSVLDIASGSGIGAKILGDLSKKYVGVDKDINAVNYALRVPCDFDKSNFLCNDAVSFLKINSIDFGVTVSFETIEHLNMKDIEYFFANIPSKVFIFSIPSEKYMPLSKFHISHINKEGIKFLLGRNNFHYEVYYQHVGGRINTWDRATQNYIFVCHKEGFDPKIPFNVFDSRLWYSSFFQVKCLFFMYWVELKRVGLRLLGRKF